MNHVDATARSLGFPFESGESMANIAVRLLDSIGQILAKKVAIFGKNAKKSLPLIGHKSAFFIVNFLNKLS